MTREDHLQFCNKCLNRKFDKSQGVICNLTGRIADFEDTCPDFKKDELVEDKKLKDRYEEITPQLSAAVIEKLRYYQDFNFAVAGGLLVVFISAIIWAFITVSTQFQIGYMAIGVGFAVGLGVRYFGAGIDKKFGYTGSVLSLIGCLLGNFFSQIGFIAEAYTQGYFETLTYLNFSDVSAIMIESFQPMDLLFYGIAVYAGYRSSFRPLPKFVSEQDDLTPPLAKYRMPLTIVSLIIIGFTVYNISQGASGFKTFFYESGERMSEGELVNGKPDGTWKYWYENGQQSLIANYIIGLEDGNWKWFNEQGYLLQDGHFNKGLEHGKWISYYWNGNISDSGQYTNGRMNGLWTYFFEDGNISSSGEFVRDLKNGFWKFYHNNGKISSSGKFKENEAVGIWETRDPSGKLIEKVEYLTGNKTKIIFASDYSGKPIVKDGNGVYNIYYNDGSLMQTGKVEDGEKTGIWKSLNPDGSLKEEGEFINGVYKLNCCWDKNGTQMITNGNGSYTSLYEGTDLVFESGHYINGFKSGIWKTFYQGQNKIMQEYNFSEGKRSGKSKFYFENGIVYSEGIFFDDLQDGEWIWYFENGIIESSVNFNKGKKEGIQVFWSEYGDKVREEIYKNGKFISETLLTIDI